MGSKWPVVKLRDIVEFNTGKLNSNAAKTDGKYPFFTCSPETLFIDEYAFDCEAVLLAGNNASGVFGVKYFNGKFNAYQRTYVITPKNNVHIDIKWLYFQICHVTAQLQKLSVGTATKFLTKAILDAFEIKLPPLAIQISISHQLWTLESKITLNRQINQTLEQMAQTLFKSWFVDFAPVIDNALDAGNEIPESLQARADRRQKVRASQDYQPLSADVRALFPAEFEESELGWVPKGWMVNYLNESTNIVYGKNLSTSKVLEVGYPVYGGNGIIGFYDQFLYKHQQVLVSCRGAASGKVHLSKPYAYVTNNSLIIENNSLPVYYLYQYLLTQDLTSLTSGSAQPQMTIANMNPVQILIPSNNILDIYTQHTTGFYEFVLKSEAATESLIQLRDTLLPKLISGELRLDDLPDEVVTVANE